MTEIKFEIKLIAKEPINGYKTGATLILVNSIFDKSNGVAFWQIDRKFDLVYKRQFTGFLDTEKLELFDGDIIVHNDFSWIAVIEWSENGSWVLRYIETNRTVLLSDRIDYIKKIGNKFENPELLKQSLS